MTNFIRDVREDVAERDRVYLPLETLRRHGVSEDQILNLEFDDDVAAAIREELVRTERLYEEGVAGSSTSRRTASSRCCSRRCCTRTTIG